MSKELPFETELYTTATTAWPEQGKHILATATSDTVIVYQAYKPAIAEWVTLNQTFKGCPGFSMERMTWIKPNFLWMMYRSGWASKVNQERILAIFVKECGFQKLLGLSKRRGGDTSIEDDKGHGSGQEGTFESFGGDDVRIQWDPDHDPYGNKVERRAIQLGIRGRALEKFVGEWIVSVSDVTDFVNTQHMHVQNNELELLQVPVQRVYNIQNDNLRKHIELDDLKEGH